MKKILISSFCSLLISFACLSASAQVLPAMVEGKFIGADAVNMDSISHRDLQDRAWEWSANRYKFARETPRKKRTDQILANAWHDIYLSSNADPVAIKMFYTLEISIEENAYRYQLSNIHYKTYADSLTGATSDRFTAEMLFGKQGIQNNGEISPLAEIYFLATQAYFRQLLGSLKMAMMRETMLAKN
ncbi:MAG: DUF4468 domain-containing protein [Bacteroidota bacterium]